MRRARVRPDGDDGQALLVATLGLVLLAAMVVLAIEVGAVLAERSQASAAADAAALAGALEGPEGAEQVAEANGAELESFRRAGPDVWVVVRVGRARAEARARVGVDPVD